MVFRYLHLCEFIDFRTLLSTREEFIEFRTLLSTREEPLSVPISSGVINLHQGPKFKTPINIAQRTDALHIRSSLH